MQLLVTLHTCDPVSPRMLQNVGETPWTETLFDDLQLKLSAVLLSSHLALGKGKNPDSSLWKRALSGPPKSHGVVQRCCLSECSDTLPPRAKLQDLCSSPKLYKANGH